MIEEYIDGEFTKHVNNTGIPCDEDSDIRKKCESLAHFSYERPGENLVVVDMQGSVHLLFDPEIASMELLGSEEVLFCSLIKKTDSLKPLKFSYKIIYAWVLSQELNVNAPHLPMRGMGAALNTRTLKKIFLKWGTLPLVLSTL